MLGIELPALRQQLQREGRRRHRESEADDQRRPPRFAEDEIRGRTDDGRRDRNLRKTQTEYGFTQYPEPGGLELEADHEHEEYDAELRDVQGAVDAAYEAKASRSDDDSRGEVAQHRA